MDDLTDTRHISRLEIVDTGRRPATRPLSALAISTTFLSKMARTNEEQQPKANSYLW
jgi:hypothetical protein